ncbi:MAG: helix-turn-helix domain-containing protein [Chloroflexota bacterium]|nr:helix-turn-helix domain-containing protein [Chloroflexota bacterium]
MKNNEILLAFGRKVRAERMKQHLSQEALATRAGLHRTYIGMIERAEKNITLMNIGKVAQGLGVAVSDLFLADKVSDDDS